MKRFAWAALAVVLMVPAPGSAFAGKPEKAKEPKAKAEAPGQSHAPGQAKAKKAEPPATPKPRGKAHGVVRRTAAAEPAPSPAAPEAPKAREGREDRSPGSGRSAGSGRSGERSRAGRGKLTLCHATGSVTNPFVVITVSVNATTGNGHGDHARDVIPAPAAGCPSSPPDDPGTPADPGTPGDPDGKDPADDPRDPVPAGGGGGDSVLVGQPVSPAAETTAPVKEELPFTGLPLALLALLGVCAMGIGVLLRRKGRPVGSTAGPASR